MVFPDNSVTWVPFPQIPQHIKTKYECSELFMRPFGLLKEDLGIALNQDAHPFLVTHILQCCTREQNGEKPNQDIFWDLTIGKRIESLIKISSLENETALAVSFRCSDITCQQQIEIEFSGEELTSLQGQNENTDLLIFENGKNNIQIRKPTGRDQLEWLKLSFPDEEAAIKAVIHSLIVETDYKPRNHELLITSEEISGISEAMEKFDPLVNFSFWSTCPYCERGDHYEINLEELALSKIYIAQLQLIGTINRLAAHYHWSESQILSIPPWRRFHYLTLIANAEK